MAKVIVLCGGDSDEREVSLRSGAAVAAALRTAGYDVAVCDPARQGPDYESALQSAGIVFPVLHGAGGEDGTIQSWLEERNIRYVGADAASSALCFDKWRTKQALITAGLPTPEGAIVTRDTFSASPLADAPFVLKPFDGGSSVDTAIIRDISKYDKAGVLKLFDRHPQMLLEQLITGTEITVPVLLGEALPVIEIVPPKDGEFDYENKYNGRTQELCPAQSVSEDTQQQAQKLALRIHKLLGVRDMSRTDMMIDTVGSLWVLEVNTIPGMTDQSLLPKAAAVAGYPMPELCSRLVQAALKRG